MVGRVVWTVGRVVWTVRSVGSITPECRLDGPESRLDGRECWEYHSGVSFGRSGESFGRSGVLGVSLRSVVWMVRRVVWTVRSVGSITPECRLDGRECWEYHSGVSFGWSGVLVQRKRVSRRLSGLYGQCIEDQRQIRFRLSSMRSSRAIVYNILWERTALSHLQLVIELLN